MSAKYVFDAETEMVAGFNQKFGLITTGSGVRHLTDRKLKERISFLQEELDELRRGAEAQDMCEIADALVDLVYVAKGTAIFLGLPWEELFLDVHRANMSKERGVGKRGNLSDCVKPEGWVGPRTAKILAGNGYAGDAGARHDDPEHQ